MMRKTPGDCRRSLRPPPRTAWPAALFIIFILILPATSPAAGASGAAAPVMLRAERAFDQRADLRKVLSVVEHRTKDGKVLERMTEKISTLGGRELHLAASLCERISRDDNTARADIAFSIVTALIVLS